MADDPPITRLRRIRVALAAGQPVPAEDAAWHAAKLEAYELEAPAGVTLDEVLGLNLTVGGGKWWMREARERRDRALIELAREHLPECGPAAAADRIGRLAARRAAARTLPLNAQEALVDSALRAGGGRVPKRRQLVSILAKCAIDPRSKLH